MQYKTQKLAQYNIVSLGFLQILCAGYSIEAHGWQFTFFSELKKEAAHSILFQSLLVVVVGLVIHLQLPTPHSTTSTSAGGGWACDFPAVTHTTLYYNHFCWWGLGL